MITTTLSASSLCKSQVIALGRQLENNYRQIIFDCSDFSETITGITLVHQRSQDTAPYIVDTQTGTSFTWTISDTDTLYYGYGKGEIRISFDTGLAKSIAFTTMTIKSITADTVIPEALQSWYDAMIEYIDEHSVTLDEVDQLVEEYLEEHPIQAPVQSVNSMTGDVVITAASLGALTSETDPVFGASAAAGITAADITAWNGKYTKPASGIPATDLTSTVQSRLLKTGGSTGQVLAKVSGTNYDVAWTTVSGGGAVDSVNGQTGVVVLDADDVGALPDSTVIPSKTSDLTNDSGYITSAGAPVQSVNGQTGAVTTPNTTYTLSMSGNVITLTPSSGQASSVTLPDDWTVQTMTASDTAVTLNPNVFSVFPEMATLAVTVTAVGMYAFRFTSGTTATTLTVNGATMPDSFEVESGKVYEVNVYQGYGVVSEWTA